MTAARFEPPLSADDPRLGEWIDGRLPEAEAAQVARLVAASAELTRLVADLRRQKAALAALPASPLPAGFVQDVIAALDPAGDTADDDAEVEAEWRRIERERLEEEIAEASKDAAEPVDEPMRHRWPWLALAGALAAGVLAAVVINRSGGRDGRDVALVDGPRAESLPQEQLKRGRDDRLAGPARKEKDADTWLAEADARDKKHQVESQPAEQDSLASLATSAAAGEEFAAHGVEARQKAGMPNAKQGASFGATAKTDAAPEAAMGAEVRTMTYRVRTAADRKRLEDLLAASRGENTRVRRRAAEEVARAFAAPEVPLAAKGDRDGRAGERIEISGPPGMIADLVAALEAGPEAEAKADRTQAAHLPGDPLAADAGAEAADAVVLVIEIVDESAAGPAEAKP